MLEEQNEGPRFGDIAIQMGFLTPEQVDVILKRQERYKALGIAVRIDEIAVEMGVIARVNCSQVLKELQRIRREQRAPRQSVKVQDDELIPPCQVGDFDIEARIGGVMGAVFKAYDRVLQKKVALKILPDALAHNKKLQERFRREAAIASRLKHPNIVECYRTGNLDGRIFMVMEFVEGEVLSDLLRRLGRLAEYDVLVVGRELGCALFHAHSHGLIHRDVKPGNIIVDEQGRVRLTDLGLAKILADDQRLTESGIAIGTPHYISPEQARGDRNLDQRTDLYSVGVTMYQLLTGILPFDGPAAEVMKQHVFDPPPDPKQYAPESSQACRDLILRLMHKDPDLRFPSADFMVQEIDLVLSGTRSNLASMPQDNPQPTSVQEAQDSQTRHDRTDVNASATAPFAAIFTETGKQTAVAFEESVPNRAPTDRHEQIKTGLLEAPIDRSHSSAAQSAVRRKPLPIPVPKRKRRE